MIVIPNNIQVHNNKCIGCIEHNKDIMISIDDPNSNEIHDIFLTTLQAHKLILMLSERLGENNKKDV